MKPNQNQIRWVAGKSSGKLLACVDKLAALYLRLETLTKLASPPRDELLRLQSEFTELRAPLHAARCQAMLDG